MISPNLNRVTQTLSVRNNPTAKLILVVIIAALAQIGIVCAWSLTGNIATHPLELVGALGVCIGLSAAATVGIIGAVLRPVNLAAKFILEYDASGRILEADEAAQDEMGGLVRKVRNTIVRLDLAKKEVDQASKIDLLTGLLNRRFSDQRLQKDLSRAARCGASYSVILIDMDDFKYLNDRFDTTVGDACLQHFAAVASAGVRDEDWIGRWDGDKFLIGLWDANSEITEKVISRIRRSFASSRTLREAGLTVTASYGYASLRPSETEHDLLMRVESALRSAKFAGKNRACGETAAVRG